jgi:hypothetical protein
MLAVADELIFIVKGCAELDQTPILLEPALQLREVRRSRPSDFAEIR